MCVRWYHHVHGGSAEVHSWSGLADAWYTFRRVRVWESCLFFGGIFAVMLRIVVKFGFVVDVIRSEGRGGRGGPGGFETSECFEET
jgi:hypothetical protein